MWTKRLDDGVEHWWHDPELYAVSEALPCDSNECSRSRDVTWSKKACRASLLMCLDILDYHIGEAYSGCILLLQRCTGCRLA